MCIYIYIYIYTYTHVYSNDANDEDKVMFMPGSAPLDDLQAPSEAAGGAGPPEAEIV